MLRAGQILNEPARRLGPGVPQDRAERDRLQQAVDRFLAARDLVPPLTLDEVRSHASDIAQAADARQWLSYIMVLCGSAVWRETMAAIPFDRRVLLLPQCLKSSVHCRAQADDVGLVCAGCGHCVLAGLEHEALNLGYMVLIAEGSTLVSQLLGQGCIDAVIGVSCLEALEKSFPLLAAEAIPGMAVPLHRDGCRDTAVDVDRVRDLLRLRSARCEPRRDLDALRARVEAWFGPEALDTVLGADGRQPARLAREWLGRSGKRWRPLLTACVWQALTPDHEIIPDCVRRLAVAVECFHKASLVHDDIEDDDDERYETPTLHVTHGIPIAINTGDLLLGEGYRLIAGCGLPPERLARVLDIASRGHRDLAVGQGEELAWRRDPKPLDVDWVLDVFRLKTAPAFEVAIRLGALCAGDEEPGDVLTRFSAALGVAYQIRDDIEDARAVPRADAWAAATRPSLITALALDFADEHLQADVVAAWRTGSASESVRQRFCALASDRRVFAKAGVLFEHYRNEAVRSLAPLRHVPLKALLRRLVQRILGHGTTA
jgi:geranylgeranyl pyrophosphate synthase